jgi:hypothetical protein
MCVNNQNNFAQNIKTSTQYTSEKICHLFVIIIMPWKQILTIFVNCCLLQPRLSLKHDFCFRRALCFEKVKKLYATPFWTFTTIITSKQLPPVNNNRYFGVPRVVVVLRFDCTYKCHILILVYCVWVFSFILWNVIIQKGTNVLLALVYFNGPWENVLILWQYLTFYCFD